MCGIVGIVNFTGEPVSGANQKRMNDFQYHRGPDGEGVHLAGNVGLGHWRLAIIDPKRWRSAFP